MLNTKNVLMLAVLSAGILTEDNDDNNCNETTHKIIRENDCKAVNEYEHISILGSPENNNQFVCNNILTSPANGDDNVFGDSALEP